MLCHLLIRQVHEGHSEAQVFLSWPAGLGPGQPGRQIRQGAEEIKGMKEEGEEGVGVGNGVTRRWWWW